MTSQKLSISKYNMARKTNKKVWRKVRDLRFIYGWRLKDIAKELNLSIGTVCRLANASSYKKYLKSCFTRMRAKEDVLAEVYGLVPRSKNIANSPKSVLDQLSDVEKQLQQAQSAITNIKKLLK